MKFVATKTAEQLDLQALHCVRERWLASARALSIRSARSWWSAVFPSGKDCGSCAGSCRASWRRAPMLHSPRMLRLIEDLAGDWRRLDGRIESLSGEIETLARQDKGC